MKANFHCTRLLVFFILHSSFFILSACSSGHDDASEEDVATTAVTTRSVTITLPVNSYGGTTPTAAELATNDIHFYAYPQTTSGTFCHKYIEFEEELDDGAEAYTFTVDIDEGIYDIYIIANAGSTLTGSESQSALEAAAVTYASTGTVTSDASDLPNTTDGLLMACYLEREHIAENDSIEAALTFACARLQYTLNYSESYTGITYTGTDGSTYNTIASLLAGGGDVNLYIESIQIRSISAATTIAVASEVDAYKSSTFTYDIYEYSDGTATVANCTFSSGANGNNSLSITGTAYLPERYVSDEDYQTVMVVSGYMKYDDTSSNTIYAPMEYTITLGGDATSSTTAAEERTNLGTLARGADYVMTIQLGYLTYSGVYATIAATPWTTTTATDIETDI